MFQLWRKPSIHRTTLVIILFAGIFAAASAFVVIYNESIQLDQEISDAKSEYLQNQKDKILEETAKLYRLIEHRQEKVQDKDVLKTQIDELVEAVFKDPLGNVYPFVYQMDTTPIHDPHLNRNQNQKLSSLQSTHHERVIEKLRAIAMQGGGFYEFSSDASRVGDVVPNLVFVRIHRDLGWMIGSGVYLDDFNTVIQAKEDESHNKITAFILKIVTLTLFLYLAGIIKYRYLTERISNELKFIDESFKEASKTYQFVDESKIKFVEFKEISAHANRMIEKIKEKNNALLNLNTNLERIVEEKTRALKKSVAYTEELLQNQDRFVKNAIHEINTPLTIILMNIELYNLKHDRNAYLTKIEAAVKVLENIYEDLSYVVKKNRVEYLPGAIDVSRFLQERVEYFLDVAEGNDVSFTCRIDTGIVIDFNDIELQRVIDNNLSNAIKYAEVGTTIDVRLHVDETTGCLRLCIGNHGETIQDADKLFERFYREDKARGGFGLGLNIVKEICEKNHVSITVRSKNNYTQFEYVFECPKGKLR